MFDPFLPLRVATWWTGLCLGLAYEAAQACAPTRPRPATGTKIVHISGRTLTADEVASYTQPRRRELVDVETRFTTAGATVDMSDRDVRDRLKDQIDTMDGIKLATSKDPAKRARGELKLSKVAARAAARDRRKAKA